MNSFLFKSILFLLALVLIFLIPYESIAQKKKVYTEDLKYLRIPENSSTSVETIPDKKIPTLATHAVNEKIDGILDSIDNLNKSKRFTDGFKIQIYSGQNKQEAIDARNALGATDLKLTADIQFLQPKFSVVVGKYYNKLAAHRDLYKLIKIFPDAIIIPEKLPIQ